MSKTKKKKLKLKKRTPHLNIHVSFREFYFHFVKKPSYSVTYQHTFCHDLRIRLMQNYAETPMGSVISINRLQKTAISSIN